MTVRLVYLDWFSYEPPEYFSVLFVLFLFRLSCLCDLSEMAFPNTGDGSFKHATSMFSPFDTLFVYFPLVFISSLLISSPLFSFLLFLFFSFPFFSFHVFSFLFSFHSIQFNIHIICFKLITLYTNFKSFLSRKQITR